MLFNWFGTQEQIRGARFAAASASAMSEQANQGIVLAWSRRIRLSCMPSGESRSRSMRRQRRKHCCRTRKESARRAGRRFGHAGRPGELVGAATGTGFPPRATPTSRGRSWKRQWVWTRAPPRATLQPIEARSFPEGESGGGYCERTEGATRPESAATAELLRGSRRSSRRRTAWLRQVSAYGNWEMDQASFAGDGGNNWVAGVQLSLDILPMAKRAQLAQQRAAQQKAEAQERAGSSRFGWQ